MSFKNYGEIPISNQKELNSYIHRCIGKDNEYHDSFSNYSISSIQGGKLNKSTGMLCFEEEPYIYISSPDSEFVQLLVVGAMSGQKLFNMEFSKISLADFNSDKFCDTVITISPILLKRESDGVKITIDDDGWIDSLKSQCIKKLNRVGLTHNGFNIELRNPERAKKKMVYVGNVFNPCSQVSLKVYGDKKSRDYIYSVGFGNSCGSGFGSVKLYE